ncbi:hypothetical protein L204_100668 [Cryptococcus depauperatus]
MLFSILKKTLIQLELNVGHGSAFPSRTHLILTSQSAIPRTTPTIPFSSLSAPLLELTNVGSVNGLVERANMESSGHELPQDPSSPFPAPQAYWHVPNGPFEFDNVGHCRPVADATLPHYASGCCEKGRVKWWICAD